MSDEKKDKKDKDKKEKSDKPDKKEKSDKAEKSDKDKSDKKEKVDKADKKEKVDKKADADPKDKKSKSDKDKPDTDKKSKTAPPEAAKSDKKTKDKDIKAKPDTKDKKDTAKAAAQPDSPEPESVMLDGVKVFREWKDEDARHELNTRIKSVLGSLPEAARVSGTDYSSIVEGTSREFMRSFKHLDSQGLDWIESACKKELKKFEKAGPTKGMSLTKDIQPNDAAPVVPRPLETLEPPASSLLPRAVYLRDPYYKPLLNSTNRRREIEDRIESLAFLHPGCGTIRVLCSMGVKIGSSNPQSYFAVVARDWCGAYCFFLLEKNNYAVVQAYPILSHVDFPEQGFTSIAVSVDDTPFIMSFRDQDDANHLHDSLKMAMFAMYGNGSDDERIVRMRGLSIEFSASDSSYFPAAVEDPVILTRSILRNDRREGKEMDLEFASLRLVMRTVEGRDAVLRTWVQSVSDISRLRRMSPIAIANHIRVVEEAMNMPVYHDDISLPGQVQELLSSVAQDQSEAIRKRVDNIRVMSRIINPVLEKYISRVDLPDLEFPLCFEPEEGSRAALEVRRTAAENKALFHDRYFPPGVYFTVLVYCNTQLLCTSQGTLMSEQIYRDPSQAELDAFTADSDDFRWVMSLGGYSEGWFRQLDSMLQTYNTVGVTAFRARFLQAASRLYSSWKLPSLGMIFDTPVIQKGVGCAHVISVLRVDSKDSIPVGLGKWRNAVDVENDFYLHSLSVRPSYRLEHLSTSPTNCLRFIKAAIDFRESADYQPQAGFYLGHVVLSMTSEGPALLVPEGNRHLPPLVKVCNELPTLIQWRWIQSLNERKRRTQSFGFPADLGDIPEEFETFEGAFARATRHLEDAIGVPVTQFYDLDDIVILDEAQTTRAIFAVSMCPISFKPGKVPMVLQHCETFEHALMSVLWPRLYRSLYSEKFIRAARTYTNLQPFAADEILRLRSDNADPFDVEKFMMTLSWLRPISSWFRSERSSLVEKFGGDEDFINSRSVDEIVDVAVANCAAEQDINLKNMQSLLYEAAIAPHLSMTTLLNKLREAERVSAKGYNARPTVAVSSHKVASFSRTYDELYEDEIDDDHVRPATVYRVPCSVEELIFKDIEVEKADNYFMLNDIVKDVVDLSCVMAVDVGELEEVGNIINDMISVLEASEDLVDRAQLLSLEEETEEEALRERDQFQRNWLSAFLGSDADGQGGQGLLKGTVDSSEGAAALFYEGSTHYVDTFEDGVKICLAKASNSHHQLQQLLSVATSTIEALDLVSTVQQYGGCLSRREALIGTAETGGENIDDVPMPSLPLRENESRTVNEIILVSKEFDEFIVPGSQPLRSLLLADVNGKIRFPSVTSSVLEVVSSYLRCNDFTLPTALRRLELTVEKAEAVMDVAVQFKAPMLALRIASILFASRSGAEYFSAPAVAQMQRMFTDSFMFEYPVKDWLAIETLGGDTVAAAMDVMWFIRFTKEALQEMEAHNNNFPDHEGSWKQLFAETRVRAFLCSGVQAVTQEEVVLWTTSLGRYVEYISFRNQRISDGEVEVLAQCCPNLRSLDLASTNISNQTVKILLEHCKRLVECSVTGTTLGGREVDALRRHCAENKQKM